MGVKLLPLSVAELCAHALELERDAGVRFQDYAVRMREIGDEKMAAVFEEFRKEQDQEVRTLESAAGDRPPNKLSPWEYVWRLNYMPDGMEEKPRLVPINPREALQLATLAKRRAEAFYNDVSDNARDAVVRSCAAEMVAGEQGQIARLEHLLETEQRDDNASLAGSGDFRLQR